MQQIKPKDPSGIASHIYKSDSKVLTLAVHSIRPTRFFGIEIETPRGKITKYHSPFLYQKSPPHIRVRK